VVAGKSPKATANYSAKPPYWERASPAVDQVGEEVQQPIRELWELFFVCCLYSVDVKICEGNLSRDPFLF
jgi:hypothetical protein